MSQYNEVQCLLDRGIKQWNTKGVSWLKKEYLLPLAICSAFFLAYSILSLVKHDHFLSGYDLGILDQVVWKYSLFKAPITTVHAFAFINNLEDHVEFIYILLAPFYWIWSDVKMLLLLQSFFLCFSGIPIFLFTKHKISSVFFASILTTSYLLFFGIQNALWNDVHSAAFGASFIPWFLYFLYKNHKVRIILSFLLIITAKEDMAFLAGLILFVFFFIKRTKLIVLLFLASILYEIILFYVYYPHFTTNGYIYLEGGGLFDDPNPLYLFDTPTKRQTLLYSLGWFGFFPLLSPLYLIPALGDIAHYFIFGKAVEAATEIFMHYRVTLGVLLVWPTIITLSKLKKVPQIVLGSYLLICAAFLQYYLHLPLSYLSKQWFWDKPPSVENIQKVLRFLPKDASVVSQNNITPHITHRDNIYTLWPDKQDFKENSPCGKVSCPWLRWLGTPRYMIVDLSPGWDIRHMLQNRDDFLEAVAALEKRGLITKYKEQGDARLFIINKKSL